MSLADNDTLSSGMAPVRFVVHLSATGLTANGKYRKIGTNYAGKKFNILGTGPDYWAFHPTTALSEGPETLREQHQTNRNNTKMIEILKIAENGPIWLEMS